MHHAAQRPQRHAADVRVLRDALAAPPPAPPRPVLVLMSGLPGSGKSTLAERLASQVPLVVLESDALRRALFSRPRHAPTESARLFAAVHALLRDLLREGRAVLLDATNLAEDQRRPLYDIAEEAGAGLVAIWVTAPPEVVFERLGARARGETAGMSDADWGVYLRMRDRARPPRVPHYVVDTSGPTALVEGHIRARIRQEMGDGPGPNQDQGGTST